jgi:hypothetical protein
MIKTSHKKKRKQNRPDGPLVWPNGLVQPSWPGRLGWRPRPDPTLSRSPLTHARTRRLRVTLCWLSDVLLRRRSGQPTANPRRLCSRTRFRRTLLFILHQLPLTETPPTPTLAPKAPPCRRWCPAAPGPLQLLRVRALVRLTALYYLLQVDLILAVSLARPQPGTLAVAGGLSGRHRPTPAIADLAGRRGQRSKLRPDVHRLHACSKPPPLQFWLSPVSSPDATSWLGFATDLHATYR